MRKGAFGINTAVTQSFMGIKIHTNVNIQHRREKELERNRDVMLLSQNAD